jgi:hypothetical protein
VVGLTWSGKIYKHHIEQRTGGAEMAMSWLLFQLALPGPIIGI